jgi:hypothetical protein
MNEFDPSTSYFDLIPVELYVRDFSKELPSVYSLVHYACCREILNKDKHKLIRNLRLAKDAKELIQSAEEKTKVRGEN